VRDGSSNQRGKHFLFSEKLFNPESSSSTSNRPQLFASFLRQKVGDAKFEKVLHLLGNSENPVKLLDQAVPQDG
jgi:hypothetical protein